MQNFEELVSYQNTAREIIEKFNLRQFADQFSYISSVIRNPGAIVTMLGETSSGKSTLLNGLIGEAVFPVSATPTTADIIEVEFSAEDSAQGYFGILRDGNLQKLDRGAFIQFSKVRNQKFNRIKYLHPCGNSELAGLRVFDAPGFNSIYEQHEEVIDTFLPESDCIIYLVHYHSGVAVIDEQFLKVLKSYKEDGIPLLLVVNRAPGRADKNDRRFREILERVTAILSYEPKSFIVHSMREADRNLPSEKVLPRADDLWAEVKDWLSRPERMNDVRKGVLQLQLRLYSGIQKQVIEMLLDQRAKEEIRKSEKELLENKNRALELVGSRFSSVKQETMSQIDNACERIIKKSNQELATFDDWTQKMEAVAFFNSYFLKTTAEDEYKVITNSISDSLEKLNKELEDLINTAVDNYCREMERISTSLNDVILTATKSILKPTALNSLTRVLATYGGRGGADAGVANLAKTALKQGGKLFGKTFSKDTHNALAILLKKFKITKWLKYGGPLVNILIEGAFFAYDSFTWKKKLREEIEKSISAWGKTVKEGLCLSLEKLESTNNDFVNKYFTDLNISPATPTEGSFSIDEVQETANKVDIILNEIEQKIKE